MARFREISRKHYGRCSIIYQVTYKTGACKRPDIETSKFHRPDAKQLLSISIPTTVRRILLAAVLIIAASSFSAAQTLSTPEEISRYAVEHNLDYRKTEFQAEKAVAAEKDLFILKESTFSVSAITPDFIDEWSGRVSAEIPIIDQLFISAQIDERLNSEFGLTLSPLVHSDSRVQGKLNTSRTRLQAENTRETAGNAAVQAALNWMNLKRQLDTQNKMTELSKTAYEEEKIRYEAGESVLDDVKSALIEWSEEQNSLTSLKKDVRQMEAELYAKLGAFENQVTVEALSIAELREALINLKQGIDPEAGSPETATSVLLSQIEAQSAQAALEHTWLFEPQLQVSTSVTNPGPDSDGGPSLSGSLTLTFGPDDWNASERIELQKELSLVREEAESMRQESIRSYNTLLLAAESAVQTTSVKELEREQTQLLYKEAEMLHKQGNLSELELQEAHITLENAENALYQALVNEYITWMNIMPFMSN